VAEGLLCAALSKPLLWRDLVQVFTPEVCEADAPAVEGPKDPSLSRGDDGQRLKVLYAEDNRTNRLVFEKYLRDVDIELHFAEDGQIAVDKFVWVKPDIVFMDVSMPRMDGREATRLIRALPEGAQVPIIALTAHALREEVERIMAAGMNAMLSKPLSKAELFRALQDHAPAGFDLGLDQLSRRKTGDSGAESSGA
jgi:CheY-like chemotaxis protein